MMRSIKAGRRLMLNDVGLFSDGTAVKQVGVETFKLTRQYVDDFITVDTDAICAGIKDIFQDTRSVLEHAGALALAGATHYATPNDRKHNNLIDGTSGDHTQFERLRKKKQHGEDKVIE